MCSTLHRVHVSNRDCILVFGYGKIALVLHDDDLVRITRSSYRSEARFNAAYSEASDAALFDGDATFYDPVCCRLIVLLNKGVARS